MTLKLPGVLKVQLFLFLPLYGVLVLAYGFHLNLSYLQQASVSFYYLTLAFPTLLHLDYGVCQGLLAAGAILISLFYWCPARFKKPLLMLFAFAYIGYILGLGCLLPYWAALLIIWWAHHYHGTSAAKWILVPLGLAVSWYGTLAQGDPKNYFAWGLSFFLTLKSVSYLIDAEASVERPAFHDFALYMTSGFPCPFVTPWYTFQEFTRSYCEDYWKTARGGIIRIYWGLSKLALSFVCELMISPYCASFDFRHLIDRAYFSGAEFWAAGIAGYFLHLVRFVGCYQVIQGMTRLFGYNVGDQFRKPWLTTSPLDFWRRYSIHNRNYLIKYILYPVFHRWPNPYTAILAVFGAAAFINIFQMYPLMRPLSAKYGAGEWVAALWVFYAGFALLCLLEYWELHRGRSEANLLPALGRQAARWKKSRAIAMLLLLVLLMAPQYTFRISNPPPNLIYGRSLWERYAFVYGAMFLLR